MNKIQPIVFASPQPAAPATSGGSSAGMMIMIGINVVLMLALFVFASRSNPVPPGPEPGPGPSPQPVIAEVVEAAIMGHRAEAANYAKAHRRLSEMVASGEIKDQRQFQSAGEKLMKAGRDASWTAHLGALGNQHLPESFDGQEASVRRFIDSLAAGFERASQ